MTEPSSTALLARIVLPDRVFAPAGHVVVSRARESDRSGAARLDLDPQERGDADEIYSRLTVLAPAGSPSVRVVLTDGAAFEGPLRDVVVQQGLHGVAFTVELMPCRPCCTDTSRSGPSNAAPSVRTILTEGLPAELSAGASTVNLE